MFIPLAATGNRQLMPIRIERMEIPFAPRSILRLFRLESQLVEASPERVYVRDMEDEPTPAVGRLTLLQIENGRVRVFGTQGSEPCSFSAVKQLHAEHVPIELHGGFHVRSPQSHCRSFLHHDCHDAGSLPRPRLNPPSARHSFEAGGGKFTPEEYKRPGGSNAGAPGERRL